MRHHNRLLWIAALGATFAVGCAEAEQDALVMQVASVQSPIQDGYLDDFDTHVVGVVHFSGMGFGACSGTLLSPNVVLTARHCVAPTSGDGSVQCGVTTFGNTYPATDFYVTTIPSIYDGQPSDYRQAIEVVLPPTSNDFCGNDQAILILGELVPPEEALPATPRVDVPLVDGEEYYAVGFGALYDANNAPSGTRYRRDQLFTFCVGDTCNGASVAASEWRGDTGICSGDSGGPAFDMQDRVTGVASRGLPDCEFPVYGHVFGWGQWIMDTTVGAAQAAGIEAPAWATGYPTDPAFSHPVGDACSAPEQCPSGVCFFESYCTRPCNALATCPDGFECNVDGWCEIVPEPEPPPKRNNSDSGDEESSGGCTVRPLPKDPTKPIPWKIAPIAAAVALLRRRRRRA